MERTFTHALIIDVLMLVLPVFAGLALLSHVTGRRRYYYYYNQGWSIPLLLLVAWIANLILVVPVGTVVIKGLFRG